MRVSNRWRLRKGRKKKKLLQHELFVFRRPFRCEPCRPLLSGKDVVLFLWYSDSQLGKWIVCKQWQFWCQWLEVLIRRPTSIVQKHNGKAAFTRQTKVGKLVLANSSWCVWTAQKQSANTFYLSPAVCQRVCRLSLRRSHTPTWVCQREFVNFSLPCEGRLREYWRKHSWSWTEFSSSEKPRQL